MTYWKGPAGDAPKPLRPKGERASRRSFLKIAGFSFGGALLTGCTRGMEHKAIPLLVKAEEVVPGKAAWYATLCQGCSAGCGLLAKNRDGRPVKLEGNPQHALSAGGLCPAGQAGVIGLYDSQRLDAPLADGKPASWEQVDKAIRLKLPGLRTVRFLTGTLNSPTRRGAIDAFLRRFPDGQQVMVDALDQSALLDAHAEAFGKRILPRFRFEKAEVIVSFDADFLGTWISPVEYTRGYRAGRDLAGKTHSHHVQVEGRLSITGSNADRRIVAAPHEIGALLGQLAALLQEKEAPNAPAALRETAERLRRAGPAKTLVLCGTQSVAEQRLAIFVNGLLRNYGGTIDVQRPSFQKLGDRRALDGLWGEMAEGKVDGLFIAGCNPAYDLDGFDTSKVGLVVGFAGLVDETAKKAHFVCPDHHFLESWTDAEPVDGLVTVSQPLLRPLRGTRAMTESLAAWSGRPQGALAIMRKAWKRTLLDRQDRFASFELFWAQAVHDGFVELAPAARGVPSRPAIGNPPVPAVGPPVQGLFAPVLYAKAGMLDGSHAHNPWLQELPDPVTKVVWDNYACLSPAAAKSLGVRQGDLVEIEGIELPVLVQPGQHDRVVAVAVGYGRMGTDRFADVAPEWIEGAPTVEQGQTIGVDVAALRGKTGVAVRPTGGHRALASTQLHHSLEQRPIIQETTLGEFRTDRAAGSHARHDLARLWPTDHPYTGHHWGMAIDLSACTGCSACVVGCQAENNIPVVGRDEVRRQREMHWLRIDRYYAGEGTDVDVVHQPMLCHHCDNAPCETVCPVLATVHSSEGLSQQVYNRCVGTRYCSNNCPYKVRRFNFFDYRRDDRLQNMVLNPDITVRMRGIMEKCSFCVQRIAEVKAEAKREGRKVRDGEIQPACAQSCPAGAIVFGDTNDPESALNKARKSGRHYHVLEELNVQPSVGYLTLVRNRDV